MLLGPRGIRIFWVLGLVLLLGTALGAGWFFNQSATGTGPSSNEPPGLVALGYGDVRDGITAMHPLQPGRVTSVQVREGDEVKEGDLLISVNNELQRLRLREALADLEAAKLELTSMQRQLTVDRDQDILAQKKNIERLQYERDTAQREFDKANTAQTKPSDLVLAGYEDKLKAARAAIEAQQALLKKLEDADVTTPVERLKAKVKAKQALADQARQAVFECDVYAPADGTILRLFATPGETLSSQPRQPSIQFCPNTPRIFRAEILQEWAHLVQPGQFAIIEDDTRSTTRWKGKVESVAGWMSQRRSILQEPFQYNDVRTRECIVSIEPGGPPVWIGQRVRVTIRPSGQ